MNTTSWGWFKTNKCMVIYQDRIKRFGHHGNKHADQNGDVGDVEHAKENITEKRCQLIDEGSDLGIVALAQRIQSEEHGYEGGAYGTKAPLGIRLI